MPLYCDGTRVKCTNGRVGTIAGMTRLYGKTPELVVHLDNPIIIKNDNGIMVECITYTLIHPDGMIPTED